MSNTAAVSISAEPDKSAIILIPDLSKKGIGIMTEKQGEIKTHITLSDSNGLRQIRTD